MPDATGSVTRRRGGGCGGLRPLLSCRSRPCRCGTVRPAWLDAPAGRQENAGRRDYRRLMAAARSLARSSLLDTSLRGLGHQTFSRVAGAPLVGGNAVELLIDGRPNYDAWLTAIRGARSSVLFENYIFGDDEVSRAMRDALVERARAGVRVCLIRDWLGCVNESTDGFWHPLRHAGGEVRTYNPFRLTRPLGWLSRDHRKVVVVDSEVGFVSGLCASARWLGDPAKGIAPWRDTGIAVRGPAVRDIALAFAESWATMGPPLRGDLPALSDVPPVAGDVDLRVIATEPNTTGLYRLDQLVAAIAQQTLWLTDAYFVGTPAYVQSLVAAARDGVDVRLLLPAASDLPAVGALSRTGYRALLEAGIRVFEWKGMLHAKTSVVDRRWARVGSSNLNVASWMGNAEIDVGIENEAFAGRMHAQYEADLQNATEIVIDARHRLRVDDARHTRRARPPRGPRQRGSGRSAAGALRLASAVGAAVSDRRVLASTEGRALLAGAVALTAIAAVGVYQPRALAWPLAAIAGWCALSLVSRYAGDVRGSNVAHQPALEAAR